MQNLVPSFTDVTLWQKRNFVSTGGTRAKFIALNDKEEIFYFKGSKEAPDGSIRYPLEFWSEIISSKVGQLLGFNMLDYNVGFDSNHIQKIGCLSKSMIDEKRERLTEGITYLKGYSPDYDPVNDKKSYTFQFINKALLHHKIDMHIPSLIDVIIFDCIIGNSDRHQENWGFVREYIEIPLNEEDIKRLERNNESNLVEKVRSLFTSKRKEEIENRRKKNGVIRININNSTKFAPIYDSGCCLGREKLEEEIIKMNNDDLLIERYVNKGKSEIHWEGNKINHFQLLQNLLFLHTDLITNKLREIRERYNIKSLREVINKIDDSLPDFCNDYKLTDDRKEVIAKIVDLRIEKLLSLL